MGFIKTMVTLMLVGCTTLIPTAASAEASNVPSQQLGGPSAAILRGAGCSGWQYASWGRGSVCITGDHTVRPARVQDLATDGMKVAVQINPWYTSQWVTIATSSGAIVSANSGRSVDGVRIVRSDGRYLTLFATPPR